MKIKEIEIRSLFGYFDHKIPLKTDDRITIIHGPNGVGKTTVLRLISDLFKRQFLSMLVTPFDRIVIRFKPKGSLTVIRAKEELKFIYHFGQERTKYTLSLEDKKILREYPLGFLRSRIDDMIDNVERIGPSEWYDEKNRQKNVFSRGHPLLWISSTF